MEIQLNLMECACFFFHWQEVESLNCMSLVSLLRAKMPISCVLKRFWFLRQSPIPQRFIEWKLNSGPKRSIKNINLIVHFSNKSFVQIDTQNSSNFSLQNLFIKPVLQFKNITENVLSWKIITSKANENCFLISFIDVDNINLMSQWSTRHTFFCWHRKSTIIAHVFHGSHLFVN